MVRHVTNSWRRLAGVLVVVVMFGHVSAGLAQSTSGKITKDKSVDAHHELSRESRDIIAWVAKNYRIEVVWKGVPYPLPLREERKLLEGTNPTKEAVEEALVGLKAGLSKYPREVPHAAGLFKIIFGANLKASGIHIAGYSYPPSRALILEIEVGDKHGFRSQTMHHEIFHLIDRAILGQYSRQDIVWLRLNGPNFKGYQTGDGWSWMAKQQPGQAKPDAARGFVSAYAMSSVQEDKAEVFGRLMDDPAALMKMAEKDSIIQAKVQRIKQLARQASPKMDHKFFEKLAAEKSPSPAASK